MKISFTSVGLLSSIIVMAFFAFLIVPDVTLAQTAPGGVVTCNGTDCSACNLVQMINTIIGYLFGAVGLIFAVIMMKAGFGLVTSGGNTAALSAAKSHFQNALIGLLIVMAAWLVVDIIMRSLMKGGTGDIEGWGPWSEVRCQDQAVTRPWSRTGQDAIDPAVITPPTNPTTPPAAPGSLTHQAAVAQLGGQFTISSSGNCSDRNNRACTSLDGVQANTIQRLSEFQAAVGIPLVVSGGTEAGHAAGPYSHSAGYKIDLRIDPALNTYITTNFTSIGGSRWRDANGNIYYRHGPPDHWDITYRY